MQKRREIGSLDYAIVEIVSALDRLFRFALDPSALQIAGGLNIEIQGEQLTIDTKVRIQPVSWPSAYGITVRFQKEPEGWKAFEGFLIGRHLPSKFSEFSFECRWDPNGYYRFRGKGTGDQEVFKSLLAARATAEIKLKLD